MDDFMFDNDSEFKQSDCLFRKPSNMADSVSISRPSELLSSDMSAAEELEDTEATEQAVIRKMERYYNKRYSRN